MQISPCSILPDMGTNKLTKKKKNYDIFVSKCVSYDITKIGFLNLQESQELFMKYIEKIAFLKFASKHHTNFMSISYQWNGYMYLWA